MNELEISVRVARKALEVSNIFTFELVHVDGRSLPEFSAGSHLDVHLPNGLTRQYSLCNNPSERHRYLISVLKDANSRGGSRAMHDLVGEGDVLRISPPKNHFPLAQEAKRSVLLAGGIGVTPILCMAERLAIANEAFEMHYCTRSREHTAFLGRIETSGFASNVHFHFDDGPSDQKFDLLNLVKAPERGVQLYVCGPKGFMDWVLMTARECGWPNDQLHYEFFGAEVISSDADQSFEVKLASSGRIVVVQKDQTVIQALVAAGVEVQVSCEQGVCGTCVTRVIEGEPDHRDMFLTPDEQAANDQFMPCCSRSKSTRLVLDL